MTYLNALEVIKDLDDILGDHERVVYVFGIKVLPTGIRCSKNELLLRDTIEFDWGDSKVVIVGGDVKLDVAVLDWRGASASPFYSPHLLVIDLLTLVGIITKDGVRAGAGSGNGAVQLNNDLLLACGATEYTGTTRRSGNYDRADHSLYFGRRVNSHGLGILLGRWTRDIGSSSLAQGPCCTWGNSRGCTRPCSGRGSRSHHRSSSAGSHLCHRRLLQITASSRQLVLVVCSIIESQPFALGSGCRSIVDVCRACTQTKGRLALDARLDWPSTAVLEPKCCRASPCGAWRNLECVLVLEAARCPCRWAPCL